jgi:hypothetical protein
MDDDVLEPAGMIVVRVLASIRIKASVMHNNRHSTIERLMKAYQSYYFLVGSIIVVWVVA